MWGDKEALGKLFKAAKSAKKVKDFYHSKLPVTAEEGTKLGRKLGKKVLKKLDQTPGQPGKSPSEALECGKNSVRQLGDNTSIAVPERCNSLLGQFEIPGTGGWPARCHDPSSTQHPEGNFIRRGLLRGLCQAFSSLAGHEWEQADRARGKPTCNDRFPSDAHIAKIEADKQLKAKLDKAKAELIEHRKKVQEKVNAGGQVEQGDIEKAAQFIAEGAFPSFKGKDKQEAIELAGWYMGDVKPKATDGKHTPEAAWVAAPKVTAKDIPINKAVGQEAFKLTNRGPYAGLFQDASPQGSETCYSPAGLAEAQPGKNWDRISAALGYVDQNLRKNKRACKGCDKGGDKWVLACGSTAA
ncbi:hypothetical protein HIM_01938 [Hirsutella minnesotensis 3608]|nr:hypothetical protein HIM_01938 [Hirsutella minnesotensis 3608]